jgi:hypothetical protein
VWTQQQYNIHFQKIRHVYVKLDWLNWNENKVDEIQGKLIDGNVNINAESAIRRTCNLTFEIISNNKLLPSPTSYVWLNYKFRLWIGLKDLLTDEIVWFNKGIYLLNKPSVNYSLTGKTISLEGYDKMCWYDGTLNGEMTNPLIIPVGTDINNAIKSVVQTYGETKFNMDLINKTTPYTIEKQAGDTYYNVLKELCDLYAGWEIFFDENGWFVYRQIKDGISDPIVWDFSQTDLTVNYQNEPDFQNVKNHIQIWGTLHDDGTQIKYTIENNDANSPFNIDKIGRRDLTIIDENIYTNEQAQARAEYELKKHSNLNEKINISCLPIYYLDVNNAVYFNNSEVGISGKYLITNISLPLKYDGIMSFDAYKIYDI